jgi:signal-transduction protein with cAMP-binding, CBS, and nucleotidyltransferase domain
MQVKAILDAKGHGVTTVGRATPIATAAARMQMEHVGALVVSSDGRKLEGIIDERDIVRAYVRHGAELAGKSVAELMREEVVTCTPADPVRHVMATMTRHRVRHVPVIESGVIAGIVSIGDVVKCRLEELELEKDVMRDAFMART